MPVSHSCYLSTTMDHVVLFCCCRCCLWDTVSRRMRFGRNERLWNSLLEVVVSELQDCVAAEWPFLLLLVCWPSCDRHNWSYATNSSSLIASSSNWLSRPFVLPAWFSWHSHYTLIWAVPNLGSAVFNLALIHTTPWPAFILHLETVLNCAVAFTVRLQLWMG